MSIPKSLSFHRMKTFLLLVSAVVMLAADLGVISPRRAIQLSHETTRPDFVSFIVELMPSGDTNPPVRLNMTNSLIQVADIPQLPSGRVTMGVRSLFADGEESEVGVFTFNLRRSKPPAPTAMPMGVPAPVNDSGGLTNELWKIREASRVTAYPSIPTMDYNATPVGIFLRDGPRGNLLTRYELVGVTNDINPEVLVRELESRTGSNVIFVPWPTPDGVWKPQGVFIPRPLPGATNQTYGEWIAEREGKRRNE